MTLWAKNAIIANTFTMIQKLKTAALPLIAYLEKKLKVDAHYVIRVNFWINVNRVLAIISGLILSVAYAHFLTQADYGLYSYALTVIGLFSMPISTAIGSGISREVALGNYHVARSAIFIMRRWILLASGALIAVGVYYAFAKHIELAASFIVGGLFIPTQAYGGLAKSFLSVNGDVKRIVMFNLYRTPIITLMLCLVTWFTHSALWVIISSILTNTIISASFYRHVARVYRFNEEPIVPGAFASRFAFHNALISILNYGAEKIDNFLLWKFVGAGPLAIYAYATSPVKELLGLISNQSVIALPKFAQKPFHEVKQTLKLRVRQLYLITIPLMVTYIATAPLLFKYVFPQYIQATLISQLAALSLLSAPRRILQAAVLAHQHTKATYATNLIPNGVRIILAFIFIPSIGLYGAILALLLSEIVDYITLGIIIKNIKSEQQRV